MRIEHILPSHLVARRPVQVLVVGAGGNGSAIVMGLPYLHQAMRVWGLLLTYRLFAERPKTADFYRRQYKYICIDEAQDFNEAQYRLLVSLCGTEFTNVIMVGDPRQAIYVWNGADPKYLDLFQRDFSSVLKKSLPFHSVFG